MLLVVVMLVAIVVVVVDDVTVMLIDATVVELSEIVVAFVMLLGNVSVVVMLTTFSIKLEFRGTKVVDWFTSKVLFKLETMSLSDTFFGQLMIILEAFGLMVGKILNFSSD